MRVLTVNVGSTSVKVATVADGDAVETFPTLDAALSADPPDAVAHRVVHGGDHTAPVALTDAVVADLRALTALAPLHQPPALDAIDRTRARWPAVPHVAGFDTAFHATIPDAARTYAIPARFRPLVRVYGFHGLSHAWAVNRVRELAPSARRVVVAHLGGGQSLCGALDGRSVTTTMGFTPLDGLVMGTRCGSIDPGAVLWMSRHDDDVEHALHHESGLLGLAGTDDMRELHRRIAAGDDDATRAFAVWHHRIVSAAGGCVAVLGGLDALVFTGGIGEHDGRARSAVMDSLVWLGITVARAEPGAVDADDRELSAPGSRVRVFVVRAREDLQLAAETEAVVSSARGSA